MIRKHVRSFPGAIELLHLKSLLTNKNSQVIVVVIFKQQEFDTATKTILLGKKPHDNLFRTEHAKVTLRFTVLNLTNKVALYNFQSTFSGTHFVAPRSYQGQVGLTF